MQPNQPNQPNQPHKRHYVYRITNVELNKHYYGTRSSKIEPKEDLGTYYFSSSTDKSFIELQKSCPSAFKYKIIKQCKSRKDALRLEIKLHDKFDVGVNESFYNKAKQTSLRFDTTGLTFKKPPVSDLTREKLRIAGLGTKDSPETCERKRQKLIGHPVSEETRRKIGIANSKKKRTEKEKQHLREINTGKKLSTETKLKISVALTGIDRGDVWRKKMSEIRTGKTINIPKIMCGICGRTISKNNFKRHSCK